MALKILQLGYGHVGKALSQILPNVFDYAGIANSKGVLFDFAPSTTGQPVLDLSSQPGFLPQSTAKTVAECDFDVLVDLTPTNVFNAEPSFSFWKTAFSRGKHVVSANKGPLALHYEAVNQEAKKNNVKILFEATVAGGTPVINLAKHALKGGSIQRIEGILNGTTNYMLCQMESGASYESALKDAQNKGFAETDPTQDVNGTDALIKAVILANSLFNQNTSFKEHKPQGIQNITKDMIQSASSENTCYKLIANVDATSLSVTPQRISKTHPLAQTSDAWNALTFYTKNADAITIKGKGAGGLPTASAVLNDLWELHG